MTEYHSDGYFEFKQHVTNTSDDGVIDLEDCHYHNLSFSDDFSRNFIPTALCLIEIYILHEPNPN